MRRRFGKGFEERRYGLGRRVRAESRLGGWRDRAGGLWWFFVFAERGTGGCGV